MVLRFDGMPSRDIHQLFQAMGGEIRTSTLLFANSWWAAFGIGGVGFAPSNHIPPWLGLWGISSPALSTVDGALRLRRLLGWDWSVREI